MTRRRRFCTSSPSSPTALCYNRGRNEPPSPRSPTARTIVPLKRINLTKEMQPDPSFLSVKELPIPPPHSSRTSLAPSPSSDESDLRSGSPVRSIRKGLSTRRIKGSLPSLPGRRDQEDALWGTDSERRSDERLLPGELRISMPTDNASELTVRVDSACSTYDPASTSPPRRSPSVKSVKEFVLEGTEALKMAKPPVHRSSSSFSHARSRSGGRQAPPPIVIPPQLGRTTHHSKRPPVIAQTLRRASTSSLIALPPSSAGQHHTPSLRAPSPDHLILSASLRRASSSTVATSTVEDVENAVITRAVSIMPGQAIVVVEPEQEREVEALSETGESMPLSAKDEASTRPPSSVRSSTSTFDMDRLSFVLPVKVPAMSKVPSLEHLANTEPPTPRATTQQLEPMVTAVPPPPESETSSAPVTALTTPATSIPPPSSTSATGGLSSGLPLGPSSLAKAYLARSRRSASMTDISARYAPPARPRAGSASAQPRPLSSASMRALAHAALVPLPPSSDDGGGDSRPASVTSFFDLPGEEAEPPVFPWGAVELTEAKRSLSPKELQAIVLETMNEMGAAEHALVLDGFEELAPEVEARVEELDALQDRYAHEVRQRSVLLKRHVSVLRAFNGDEGARFADALLTSLSRVDHVSRRLLLVTDHVGRVERLRSLHTRAAASLGLAKLNAAYVKTKARARNAEARAKAAETERDALLKRVVELEARSSARSTMMPTPSMTPLPLASFPDPPPPSSSISSPSTKIEREEKGRLRKRSLARELADAEGGEPVDLSSSVTRRESIVSTYEDATEEEEEEDITEPISLVVPARPPAEVQEPVEVLRRSSRIEPLLHVVASTPTEDMTDLASALRRQIELSQRALPPLPPHRRSASEPADSPFGIDDDDPFARRQAVVTLADQAGWRRQVTVSNASLANMTLDSLDVGRLLA